MGTNTLAFLRFVYCLGAELGGPIKTTGFIVANMLPDWLGVVGNAVHKVAGNVWRNNDGTKEMGMGEERRGMAAGDGITNNQKRDAPENVSRMN